MPKFKFSKLVRDKIVENQISSGSKPSYRKLDKDQHKKELVKKIIEEAREIVEADNKELSGEIADVKQALDDLIEICGLNIEEINNAQVAKEAKNGAFKKGLFVDYVEVADDDSWTDYYRKNPDRYPEIE